MKKLLTIIIGLTLIASCGTKSTETEKQKATEMENLKAGKNRVTFSSEGIELVGDLYIPEGYSGTQEYPAIIVGGSWTTVKEQMAGLYAEKLAKEGFVTLAFDHRNYGESGGAQRFYEDPEAKTVDFINAMNYLKSLPVVADNKTGGVGICASGGYLAQAVAQDDDYKSFASVVPWFNTDEIVNAFYGGQDGINERIAKSRDAEKAYADKGEMIYQLTISDTDPTAAMYGPFEYYLNSSIGQVPNWSHDKFAVMSWEKWLTYRPLSAANNIKVPSLIITSKDAATPQADQEFYDRLSGEKELIWMEGGQLDFYYKDAQVNPAIAKLVEHFKKTL